MDKIIKLSQPSISKEAIEKVSDVLRSGMLVHGQECIEFERELTRYIGVKHALLVSSGSAALHVALLSLNIGPGDAVLVPDFTFAATANIVEMTGAKAVIVDVDSETYNMDVKLLEATIKNWKYKEKLKAIMPVLEFGNPSGISEYARIAKQYGLYLIEDAACAIGAKENNQNIGTFGDFACFSFHPRKTLTTGEGGLVVTNDDELARKASLLRNHGMTRTSDGMKFEMPGLNYRLTNFQAALGRVLLKSLDEWLNIRKKLAVQYIYLLKEYRFSGKIKVIPTLVEGHSWQSFMIVLDDKYDRNKIIEKLREKGIEANLGAQSMSQLGFYNHEFNKSNKFPIGGISYSQGLVLPLHENMLEQDIERVVTVLSGELN